MTTASRILFLEHSSTVLKGNPLGDPHERRLPVYLPPGYNDQPTQHYPVIWMLAGYTGWGERYLSPEAWDETIQQRLDRLIGTGAMPPVVVALPNCFTRYGGSQYKNSSAVGRYQDYVVQELVPFVDEHVRTLPATAHRGVLGKSSGGYGAWMLAMNHPDVFGGLASNSGDAQFDVCYRPDIAKAVVGLDQYADGDPQKFLATYLDVPPHERKQSWFDTIHVLAMSAIYAPNPDNPLGFDLCFDTYTGEIIPEVWQRWLAQDVVNLVADFVPVLRQMRCLYFECGNRDEFHLHLGARLLHRYLSELNVPHEYAETNTGHFDLDHRYDVSLTKLAHALAP